MAENLQTTRPADEGWTTVIRPKTGWFDIDLQELWRYRDLIMMFVKRNFTVLYKQTILGPAWIILNPLITTIIFNVVFGGMAISGGPRTKALAAFIGGFSMAFLDQFMTLLLLDTNTGSAVTQVVKAVLFLTVVTLLSLSYRTKLLPR